jgi:epoxyqueuosine reductase
MQYLHNRFQERTDPTVYFPGAKSIICVAVNYHAPLDAHSPPLPLSRDTARGQGNVCSQSTSQSHFTSNLLPLLYPGEGGGEGVPSQKPPSHGKIARYALGDDYHDILKPKLHQLADWLRAQVPSAHTRAAVDTAPVMEKELAARAGIGWLAKNTCIINERIGSWLLLGELFTTLDLPPDNPAIDRCGTCTRCIEACPTGAITEPYKLDARKCISYLTIEHRADIPELLAPQIGDWLYGCDICQEVCPWNRKAPMFDMPELTPRFPTGTLDVNEVLNWTDDRYRQVLKGSAAKRVKLPVLQRNARIVAGNLANGRADESVHAVRDSAGNGLPIPSIPTSPSPPD